MYVPSKINNLQLQLQEKFFESYLFNRIVYGRINGNIQLVKIAACSNIRR